MKRFLLILAFLLGSVSLASAQSSPQCYTTNGSNCVKVGTPGASAWGPLPVTGTVTITPSGVQNINLTQILGAAPSLTNPLWVFPATGATFSVGGYEFQLSPTITVSTAAYSIGNSLGGTITATGAARTNGGSGILDGIRLKSMGASTNTIWVYAWSKTPTSTCTDKSAFSSNVADGAFALVGFPTPVTLGGAPGAWDTATLAQLSGLVSNFKNQDTSPSTAIYLCLVTATAITPSSVSDLSINLGGIQD